MAKDDMQPWEEAFRRLAPTRSDGGVTTAELADFWGVAVGTARERIRKLISAKRAERLGRTATVGDLDGLCHYAPTFHLTGRKKK